MEAVSIGGNWFLILTMANDDFKEVTLLAGCTDEKTVESFYKKEITWEEVLGKEYDLCFMTFSKDEKTKHLVKITKLTEEDIEQYKDIIFENHVLEI